MVSHFPYLKVSILFSRKRRISALNVRNGRSKIPEVNSIKFLGVTWKEIKLENSFKRSKIKNQKEALGHVCTKQAKYGTSRSNLEKILKSTIVGTLYYGNDVYGGSSLSTLKSLNLCLNQGIRKVTGTFRLSPVKSLYAESGMLTLKNSREVISTQNMFKFLARPHHIYIRLT